MANLPIAIEILSLDISSKVKFKVFNLNNTIEIVDGSLADLERYILKIEELISVGLNYTTVIVEYQNLLAELEACAQELKEKQDKLLQAEANARVMLEKVESEKEPPTYKQKLADKQAILVSTIAVAAFGILVFAIGNNVGNKLVRGGFFLIGGSCAYKVYATKAEDSERAEKQGSLKREADKKNQSLASREDEYKETSETAKNQIEDCQIKLQQLKQKLQESENTVKLSETLLDIHQKLSDGFIFGNVEQLTLLKFLISKKKSDRRAAVNRWQEQGLLV